MPWRKGNRLHLVRESEASGRVAAIFDEAKAAFGISFVPLCFQAFAGHPHFLEAQWEAFRPLLATREFFELAERLQAEAYTYVHNYFKVPAIGEGLGLAQAVSMAELSCHTESALLLLLSIQSQAFDGPVGADAPKHAADRVVYSFNPEFVDAENAPVPVRRVLDEIRHALDLPYCSDELRALAQWPDLLFSYWNALKPSVQSVFHEQAIFRLRESAWVCAQEIPTVIELEFSQLIGAGMDADEIAIITRLTELLVRGTAASILNAIFLRIGLEGGNRDQSTPIFEERVA